MSRVRLFCLVLALTLVALADLSGEKIQYGIWTQGAKCQVDSCSKDEQLGSFYRLLRDSLGFNFIVASMGPKRIDSLPSGLEVFGQNLWEMAGAYPEMYARRASYSVFEAEGQPYDPVWSRTGDSIEILYTMNRSSVIEGGAAHFKRGVHQPGLVQRGPNTIQVRSYDFAPWQNEGLPHYSAAYNFKVGPDSTPGVNHLFAKFAVIYGSGDTWDTLAVRLLYDTGFDSAGTNYSIDSLSYDYHLHLGPDSARYTDSLMQFLVFWYGQRDLWIDKITFSDQYGRELHDVPSRARQKISDYYDTLGHDHLSQVKKWVLADEPRQPNADQFLPARMVDSLLKTLSPVIKSFVIYHDTSIARYLNLDEYNADLYPFYGNQCGMTPTAFSSEDVPDSVSLQTRLDDRFIQPNLEMWTEFRRNYGKKLSVCIQSFGCMSKPDGAPTYGDWHRRPTAREMLCCVNLSLCYGFRNISFWKYGMARHDWACLNAAGGVGFYEGAVDTNFQLTSIYYGIRDIISPAVNSIIPKLDSLTWTGACSSDEADVDPQSFVWSVGSIQYPIQNVYVHCGFFKRDGEDYVMLVNRRCLPNESQTCYVFIKPDWGPFPYALNGLYRVQDMVSGHVDTVQSPVTVDLGPGAAKLLKVTPIDCYYGTLTRSMTWTSAGSPYRIVGDLQICQSCTLTVQPGTVVTFANRSDSQNGGLDTSLTELIVNGVLNASGTWGSRIRFRPYLPTDSFATWYGIRVMPGGKATFDRCDITHAYCALKFDNNFVPSTVSNCLIDSCTMYGIKATNQELQILDNSIYYIDQGYGMYLTDSCTVLRNQIWRPNQNHVYPPRMTGIFLANSHAFLDSLVFNSVRTVESMICAIRVNGSNSPVYPAIINRAYINYTVNGILIGNKASVQIRNSYLKGGLGYTDHSEIGINDFGGLTRVKVFSTLVEGFLWGVNSQYGFIDLGRGDAQTSGRNSIYPDCTTGVGCKYHGQGGENFGYRFVMTNREAGDSLNALDNHWTWPCSTNVAPDPARIAPIVRYRPINTWTYDWCEHGGSKKLASNAPIPELFSLDQNFPNPFNPSTVISYSLPRRSFVEISIFNCLGQKVSTIVKEYQDAGRHQTTWDGRTDSGSEVASGIYFYHFRADEFCEVKKMVVLK